MSASEGGERTTSARILASPLPTSLLRRPALEARLDEAFGKRLTVVVAGAGFGKSTLLAAWAEDVSCAWYTLDAGDARLPRLARGIAGAVRILIPQLPADITAALDALPSAPSEDQLSADAFAGHLCERLEQILSHDLVLVLDDLHELGPATAGARLVESICRQAPPSLHLVLASRAEPPFSIARLRGRGEVIELDASELTFSRREVAELVVTTLGRESEDLASALHAATGGWPAEVRLAVEALHHVPADGRANALSRLRRPEGPLLSYVAEEVLEREPAEVRELLRRAAWLERVNPGLGEALGLPNASGTLASLARRGLLVQAESGTEGWYSLHALLRAVVRERWPLPERELVGLQKRAAAWFESNGQPVEALRCSMEAEDPTGIARLLSGRGGEVLWAGGAETVLRAAELLPLEARDGRIEESVGQAHALKGEWDEALACYRRAGGDGEALTAGIAMRMVVIHRERGQYAEALRTAGRAALDGSNPAEESGLLGLIAQTHRMLGDMETSRAVIADQFRIATASASPIALASAHTNLMVDAMTRDDWSAAEEHYGQAVKAAVASGMPPTIMRIHADHAALVGGREALAELEVALRLAELAGAEVYLGVILNGRGGVRARLGRLEDAVSDLTRATSILERVGSKKACWPLTALGDAYRDRGQLARSRAAYERALRLAEEAGETQGLIGAQAGLARVLARQEPEEAKRLAASAVERARSFGIDRVWTLVDAGWVHLTCGDRDHAALLAEEAEAAARRQPERAALAGPLELRALSAPDPTRESALLEEALEIWREEGNPVGEARTELALALLSPNVSRGMVERAERKLRSAGVSVQAAVLAAGPLACLPSADPPPVAVRALGGFAALRGGKPIPLSEWRSKKARDLLQILVSRRRRPVPRDVLMEALWPGQDPAKLGNRLSVALSTLRGVLDPEHRFEQEHFVAGDRQTITLKAAQVATDVEDFFAEADAGLALRAQGSTREARDLLVAAEGRYAGDFLEEVYDDWAVSLREDARSLYVAVARALADDAAGTGDDDAAARYLLRVLERDAFDERAHVHLVRTLTRAGRHGEARRAYRAYCARMAEIGVEAAPYPSPEA